jgi:hypothetical protein
VLSQAVASEVAVSDGIATTEPRPVKLRPCVRFGAMRNDFTFSTGKIRRRKLLVHDNTPVRLSGHNACFKA